MDHTKATLRQRLRAERRALSAERVAELSAVIVRHVANAPFYQRARRIGLYLPVDNEVDPTSLFHTAAPIGQTCFLPVVDTSTRSMGFVPYRPGDPLRPGAFGIPEPVTAPDGAGSLDINELDLVVQPLIGFDRTGCRLGFGGGYHDRALAARGSAPAPIRMGLAYAFQETPSLPREPHDILMGWVATEQGMLCCNEAF
ncbi:MAG: 5-formyltetrahydrofolate cyclo-ligase [Magnetococcales bacterium]|nr:5-formyltetrahydrofolate cyclo-ligase [Magnetococcales bacterium]